jgi:hypothetical protein
MIVCLAFQVGGMHFNLLKRIQHDAAQKGLQLSTDEALDALLPNFKAHIEPDLNQAQVSSSLHIWQPLNYCESDDLITSLSILFWCNDGHVVASFDHLCRAPQMNYLSATF